MSEQQLKMMKNKLSEVLDDTDYFEVSLNNPQLQLGSDQAKWAQIEDLIADIRTLRADADPLYTDELMSISDQSDLIDKCTTRAIYIYSRIKTLGVSNRPMPLS